MWVKNPNGSASLGIVWPNVTDSPGIQKGSIWKHVSLHSLNHTLLDWFHPKISEYRTEEFQRFFDPGTGFDIDGAWIDMNDPVLTANSVNAAAQIVANGVPPNRTSPLPNPNDTIFGSSKLAPSYVGPLKLRMPSTVRENPS